ncbi:MAG: hypothetical protein M3Y69_03990 [Verrucomicrobiota bacterium]|nr:hypothetical protein [Verrucomicrobiota bacterium]
MLSPISPGLKIGATVENFSKQTMDSEVTLTAVLPASFSVAKHLFA